VAERISFRTWDVSTSFVETLFLSRRAPSPCLPPPRGLCPYLPGLAVAGIVSPVGATASTLEYMPVILCEQWKDSSRQTQVRNQERNLQ